MAALGVVVWALATVGPARSAQEPARSPARLVAGRIVNAASGDPVIRAVVSLPGTLVQTTTDDRGGFSLPGNARSVAILVEALGFRTKAVTLRDTDPPTEIALEPAWTVEQIRALQLQQDDPDYRPRVERPAYPRGRGPRVLIDEGHHNAHTATGRYRAFAAILEQDGFVVEASGSAFTPELLKSAGVVVIATPIDGLDDGSVTNRSPFKAGEVIALRRWVDSGGALLVISDHMPVAAALDPLLRAFGVEGDNGYVFAFAADRLVARPMVFRRQDGSLRAHPITAGRTGSERLDSVATFTGFAFRAPAPFEPLLQLRDDSYSIQTPNWLAPALDSPKIPVGGWFQGAAARIGRGRVVVNGEAAMFTAQVRGENRRKNGLTSPEAGQNLQFLLNIMHWLSGLLP
ncbi:MAG: hypothetical protein ACKVZ0_21105 [Gemmatimonadales bacterium]